jgi:hypothetical protein
LRSQKKVIIFGVLPVNDPNGGFGFFVVFVPIGDFYPLFEQFVVVAVGID